HRYSTNLLLHSFPTRRSSDLNFPAPAWAKPENIFEKRKAFREARQANNPEAREKLREFRQTQGEDLLDLRRCWLERMATTTAPRSEEHTSELQSRGHLVCRLL